MQLGGSDQWGNMTAGVDLIHRAEGGSGHVLTSPLLTDASGVKFGKSEGNAIWLSADMTSPYAFYQYFLNIEDASVVTLLKVFTDRSREEIAELERQVADEPFRRAAQKALAGDMVTLVHGPQAYAAVQAASEALFREGRPPVAGCRDPARRGGRAALRRGGRRDAGDRSPRRRRPGRVAQCRAPRDQRRGASVNGVKVTDAEAVLLADDFLHGSIAVLRRGRKSMAAGLLAAEGS
jgi:tyrosyl-tRNA synthetase (EC 6.1.1.1)